MPDDIDRLSHATDPATSSEAIARLDASGERQRHADIVLAAVRSHPGSTAPELAAACGLEEYQVRRRLTDLKNVARVWQGLARRCRVKGTRMMTWFVVQAQREMFQ
jgi:hypothetical protein